MMVADVHGHLTEIITILHNTNIDSLVQDCINSSVLAMELLQSCANHPYHIPV